MSHKLDWWIGYVGSIAAIIAAAIWAMRAISAFHSGEPTAQQWIAAGVLFLVSESCDRRSKAAFNRMFPPN